MKRTCAEAVVDALEREGVQHLFVGPPGEHVVELYDALLNSKKIQGFLATNEYTLSFMADGYSRVTGKVGVFTSVPGPGMTNALTGITEAFLDSSPLVGIVSNVRARIEEVFQLHQMPMAEVLRPVVKKYFFISRPEEVPQAMAEAFQMAQSGEPGPVILEIPCDLYTTCGEMKEPVGHTEVPTINKERIQEFAALIRVSKQCGLYIGRGCFFAGEEVRTLSEKLQMPVASSISGRGILPEDHPLSVGFGFGSNGSKIAQEIFKQCDTVLAIGCKFAEVSTGSYSFKIPKTLIHVDINPDNLNKIFKTDNTLVSDAKIFLQVFLEELKDVNKEKNSELQEKIRKGKDEFLRELLKTHGSEDSLDLGKFYSFLRRNMQPQDTLTVDIGNHELWAISCFEVFEKGTFLCPTNFSAMGFAVPSAIAAQIARPEHRAVCCVGDGGFLMSGFELLTAVRYKLPVIFFVFNDGALGITKGLQQRFFRRSAFVDLLNPDFKSCAESFGMAYRKMASNSEIESVLKEAWTLEGPVLVELQVNYDKMSPYLQGIVKHRLKVMPKKEILHIAARFAKRTIFGDF